MTERDANHRSAFMPYRAVAKVKPRSGRPVYRTRYAVSCSCGWDTDAADFIFAVRAWRKHREVA